MDLQYDAVVYLYILFAVQPVPRCYDRLGRAYGPDQWALWSNMGLGPSRYPITLTHDDTSNIYTDSEAPRSITSEVRQ